MIEIDESVFIDVGGLYLADSDGFSFSDQVFFREQLYAQMMEWA